MKRQDYDECWNYADVWKHNQCTDENGVIVHYFLDIKEKDSRENIKPRTTKLKDSVDSFEAVMKFGNSLNKQSTVKNNTSSDHEQVC